VERQEIHIREHTIVVIDRQRRPGTLHLAPTVDQLFHPARVDSIQQIMAEPDLLSRPADTEVEMVISIKLLSYFLDVIITEIQHIELVNVQHGPTSRRRRSLNHRHSSHPMSDQ